MVFSILYPFAFSARRPSVHTDCAHRRQRHGPLHRVHEFARSTTRGRLMRGRCMYACCPVAMTSTLNPNPASGRCKPSRPDTRISHAAASRDLHLLLFTRGSPLLASPSAAGVILQSHTHPHDNTHFLPLASPSSPCLPASSVTVTTLLRQWPEPWTTQRLSALPCAPAC